MAKQRSAAADYAVYLLVRVIVCMFQALSLESARALASKLAWLIYQADRRHRLVADENLRHAFPDRGDERDQLIRSVYRHFCSLLMEIVHLPRKLHAFTWRRYVDFRDGRVVDALLSGRPLLLVTGHFGNWELGGYLLGLLGFSSYAIARPLDNPFLDDFLRRFRENTGQKLLAKKGDFAAMQEILQNSGVIATLGDQDAGPRGLFVDFFGRPASTHKAVALLAIEYDVPLLVIGTPRIGEPLRYRIVVEDVIDPRDYQGQPAAVPLITQRFTAALERIIRPYPEQYFWLHRRWKHPPPRARRRAA